MSTKIIFTEEFCQPENLYPFTLTRQIQDIRVGILTIREKWENILPSPKLIKAIKKLKNGEFISANGNTGIIFRFSKKEIQEPNKIKVSKAITIREEVKSIQFPWDIFQLNDYAICEDFQLLTK